jgi:hypothetical protein
MAVGLRVVDMAHIKSCQFNRNGRVRGWRRSQLEYRQCLRNPGNDPDDIRSARIVAARFDVDQSQCPTAILGCRSIKGRRPIRLGASMSSPLPAAPSVHHQPRDSAIRIVIFGMLITIAFTGVG